MMKSNTWQLICLADGYKYKISIRSFESVVFMKFTYLQTSGHSASLLHPRLSNITSRSSDVVARSKPSATALKRGCHCTKKTRKGQYVSQWHDISTAYENMALRRKSWYHDLPGPYLGKFLWGARGRWCFRLRPSGMHWIERLWCCTEPQYLHLPRSQHILQCRSSTLHQSIDCLEKMHPRSLAMHSSCWYALEQAKVPLQECAMFWKTSICVSGTLIDHSWPRSRKCFRRMLAVKF